MLEFTIACRLSLIASLLFLQLVAYLEVRTFDSFNGYNCSSQIIKETNEIVVEDNLAKTPKIA